MEFLLLFLFLIFLLVSRIIAGSWDAKRIEQEINSNGGKLIAKEWSPFGLGWEGESSDRIYKVKYLDREGNEHLAYVKTSLFSGVYFAKDRIIKDSDRYIRVDDIAVTESSHLKLENERLKAELERLKSQQIKS